MYRAIFTGESYLNSRDTERRKKSYIYIVYGSISCIMYLMYSSHFFPSISLELFPSPFKARKRQTFDGIEGEKCWSDCSKWCIRVTCAKVPTDHRRLTPKEQPWNLASKRENKDQLRVNLPLSLTSPPRPSNPEFACSKQRKRERKGCKLDVSNFPSLEFSISYRLLVISLRFTACIKENVNSIFFFFLQKLKLYVWVNDIARGGGGDVWMILQLDCWRVDFSANIYFSGNV